MNANLSIQDNRHLFQQSVLKVETTRYVPFRKDNLLANCHTDFRLSDPTLKIHATSAFYPLFAGIVQNTFDPDCFVEMVTLDKVATGIGFKSLADGTIDMLCSTIPNEEQKQVLTSSDKDFLFVPFAKEPLAIILNKSNKVSNLSIAQIKDCFHGRLGNWKELGGSDAEIHTYQLERGNGSQSAFEQLVKDNTIDECHRETSTMPGIIDAIAKDERGMCYAYWSYYTKMYANTMTKMVDVEGKETTSDDYPLVYDIFLIYDRHHPNENVHRLAEFLLSAKGQELVRVCNQCQTSPLQTTNRQNH